MVTESSKHNSLFPGTLYSCLQPAIVECRFSLSLLQPVICHSVTSVSVLFCGSVARSLIRWYIRPCSVASLCQGT